MSISGIGNSAAASVQSLVDMRAQLDELQRQLGTGKKSDTYAGLGLNRGLTVGLNNQLATLTSYDDTMTSVGIRLQLAQTALGQIDSIGHTVKTSALQSGFSIDASGQTADQRTAYSQLDMVLGLLNSQVGDRYLFSGKTVEQAPVETVDHIMNGDGARAGLQQLISERKQADVGANGLGRLVIPAAAGSTVSVGEDFAGSPFGLKLASVTSTLTGAVVTGPAGAPPGISVDMSAGNPKAGDTLKLSFNLPDGTTKDLMLTATTASPPGPNQFTIGTTPAATAANLQAVLTTAVGQVAGTSLAAASAVAVSQDFFAADANNPPQRVNGPPFAATGMVAGTASNTVIWYSGDSGSDPARGTAAVRIDPSINVSYGMRANEQALRVAVQNIAVFAATSYSPTDPNAGGSYSALKQRVSTALDGVQGQQKISDIQSEIAGAQKAFAGAQARHQQTKATLSDLLDGIESVPQEQVGAQILALQTSLQASLQTTALLFKTSLVNYL